MCGIAGIFHLDGSDRNLGARRAKDMLSAIRHRGPDGSGTWQSRDSRIDLAHARLSVLDLSTTASQPMISADGRLALVFNGEIYNHLDIRKELIGRGAGPWKTDHSDTEVILKAFEAWGPECVHRFRGMFAFAIWDQAAAKLWLFRDRIGVKPLYYCATPSFFAFASEIKSLLRLPDIPRRMRHDSLYHYLTFLCAPGPETFFEGIRKLGPGSSLCVESSGTLAEARYWDLLDHAGPSSFREESLAEDLLERLRQSVKIRKVSDVPVGVFLSGGVDSSTNAALFSEGEAAPVRTFSVGYKGTYASTADELGYAGEVARHVGSIHREVVLDQEDLLRFLPRMIHLQDEPLGDSTCFPMYHVAKCARDNGVIVCQVGEGADELFCGYPTWLLKRRLELLGKSPIPRVLKASVGLGLEFLGLKESRSYEALRRSLDGYPVFWGGADGFTALEKDAILGDDVRKELGDISSWDPISGLYARFQSSGIEKSPLHWMTYLDLSLRLPELLLMRVDKMTMGVALEARVPFLDHQFVEFVMGLPEEVKLRGGGLKPLLKKAVEPLIPPSVLKRRKQGFGVPIQEWMADRLGAEARYAIDEFAAQTGLLKPAGVARLFERGRHKQIWYLFNVALWWRHFIRDKADLGLSPGIVPGSP